MEIISYILDFWRTYPSLLITILLFIGYILYYLFYVVKYFSLITASAHIIHVFPGFHQYKTGALKCLVQGSLDDESNTLPLSQKPHLACSDKDFKNFLETHVPIIHDKFWPTIWCFESRAQTILRSFLQSTPPVQYESEILCMPDGGQVRLDWVHNSENNSLYPDHSTRPTIVMLPGLTGTSEEPYILHMATEAKRLGYRIVVFNNRGCGTELLTPRTYCAANTDDVSTVVGYVRERFPDAPMMGCGVSLGGMILFSYLSKSGENCEMLGAMCISMPWNSFESVRTLETPGINKHVINRSLAKSLVDKFKMMLLLQYLIKSGKDSKLKAGFCVSMAWNVFESVITLEKPGLNKHVINRVLAKRLVDNVKQNMHLFESHVEDVANVLKSTTIREFDHHFTAPMFGYTGWEDYYTDACLHDKVHALGVPVLCVNAADDPFSPHHAIPVEEAERNKNIAILVTSHGGHIGFMEGFIPKSDGYIYKMFSQYIKGVFTHGPKHVKSE